MNAFEGTNNVYLRLNLSEVMKLIVLLLVIIFILPGCKGKKIAPENLTNVSVIRETEETGNTQKVASAPIQATPGVNTLPSAKGTTEQASYSSQYHIIVRSYSPSQYAAAQEMVRKLKEQHYPAMLINKDKRFRVSIEHFSNKADADNACEEYRKITEKDDIWVLYLK